MNTQTEFLNGLTTPLGYGYIDEVGIVDICIDNEINFKSFYNSVDWLDDYQMESIATAYVEISDDTDAEDYLSELEDNNDTNLKFKYQ